MVAVSPDAMAEWQLLSANLLCRLFNECLLAVVYDFFIKWIYSKNT